MNYKDSKHYKVKNFNVDNFEVSNERMGTEDFEKMNIHKALRKEGNYYIVTGTANTIGVADSYGDIPMQLDGKPIYDLTRMKLNPVMLVDHIGYVEYIAGNFVELTETTNGLRFKAILRPLETVYHNPTKDAISSLIHGFSRSFSIGGNWYYEHPTDKRYLTRAEIFEISLVAIPADMYAIADPDQSQTNVPGMISTLNTDAEHRKYDEYNKYKELQKYRGLR